MSTRTTKTRTDALGRLRTLGPTEPWQVALLLPLRWDDLRRPVSDFQTLAEGPTVVQGWVASVPQIRFDKPPRLFCWVQDGNGVRLGVSAFGDTRPLQVALETAATAGRPLVLLGTVRPHNDRLWLGQCEAVDSAWVGRLRPVYPGRTGVIGPDTVRARVLELLPEAVPVAARFIREEAARQAVARDVPPTDPDDPSAIDAVQMIEELLLNAHLPSDPDHGRQAQEALELLAARAAIRRALGNHPPGLRARPLAIGDWDKRAAVLPFQLGVDQHAAVAAIAVDLAAVRPMRRLLSGDVGSGKTIVYGLACALCLEAGGRAAVLLPNQALAAQVATVLGDWWPDLALRLVTAEDEVTDLAAFPFLIGTTALLHRDTGPLDLVVVDEQQKFSRDQREQLLAEHSHLLEVTATCIPRSLALVRYGGVAVSRLDERVEKTIHTRLWVAAERADLFQGVRDTLADGGQVLVVYPQREEEGPGRRSVSGSAAQWERHFPGRVRCVHGGFDDEAKVAALEDLRDGRADVLVATTVVEVGIDLPRLRRVVVVHAERFGLTTLHQLRGRVARQGGAGWCDLYLPQPVAEASLQRLAVLTQTQDGFVIAEHDLRLRGFGDLAPDSERQTGADQTFLFGRPLRLEVVDRVAAEWDEQGSASPSSKESEPCTT